MKLEWIKNVRFTLKQEMIDSWNLCLLDTTYSRDIPISRTKGSLGTLYQTETGYIILERGNEQNPYILDGDLTLDEAQRAAKLFLCVGVNK